jgi:UPF0176 protein
LPKIDFSVFSYNSITMTILNIAAYRFVSIADLPALQSAICHALEGSDIKGTVLLAEEGLNLFLAGDAAEVHGFMTWLRGDNRFSGLAAKESWSDTQPFKKRLVKIKPEIIRMNHPAIQPASGRAPAVDALTLKRWLDQGHDDQGQAVVMLETRNAFEAACGTFSGAIDWHIDKFTEFPDAIKAYFNAHANELQGKTVVSFCTGGIRCEKAAILMREAGLTDVFQLDGGILTYFEQVGQAHYTGGCFVFDDRRVVDAALSPQPEASFLQNLQHVRAELTVVQNHDHHGSEDDEGNG